MNIFLEIAVNIVLSFVATVGFIILFNAPRMELAFCGLCGSISWMVYFAIERIFAGAYPVAAVFFAMIVSAYVGRTLSYSRKVPLLIYLIGSIIPLVPGAGIYYTMSAAMTNETAYALNKGIETFKVAGVIAVGIIVVLALPRQIFDFLPEKKTKN